MKQCLRGIIISAYKKIMNKFFACMMLALLPLMARSATNPVLVSGSPMSTCGGSNPPGGCAGTFVLYEYNLPNVGYHLSKFEYYGNAALKEFYGIRLTFTPDAGGADIVSSLIGKSTGESAATLYSFPITKQVVAITTYGDYASTGASGVQTMQLKFKDATVLNIGSGVLTRTPIYTMNLCGNLIGMQCSFHTDPSAIIIDKEAGCSLYDDQQVSGYSFTQTVADFTYTLYEGTTAQKTWSTTNLSCYNEAFTATYTKNGIPISAPTFITFVSTPATPYMTAFFNSPTDLGVYVVTIKGTLNLLNNPGTGLPWTTSFSFTLTVVNDCLTTTITDKVINPMSNFVSLPAITQDVTFADSKATSYANPTFCGARTYTFSPAYAFLTITGTSFMSLATSSVGDVGTYNVNLKISLTDYPAVSFITKNFDVTITCVVQSLMFSPSLAALTTLLVGINLQPFTIPFSVVKTPACIQSVAITLSPTTEAFISLQLLSKSHGDVQINGSTIADHLVYPYQLSASVDLQTLVSNFSVFIKDPCSDAIFRTTPSPVNDMTVSILDTQDQTLDLDQIQVTYPSIICAVQGIITPSEPFLSLSPDSKVVSIDTTALTLLDVGSYNFIYTVSFKNFPAAPTQSYNFKVVLEDPCLLTELNSFVLNPMTFTLGDKTSQTQSFIMATDRVSERLKVPKLCGERKYELPDDYNFLTLFRPTDQWTQKFILELQTDKPANIGNYKARIKVSLSNYPLIMPVEIQFKVDILPKIEIPMLPYFKTEFNSTTILISEKKKQWSIPLPEILSPNPEVNSKSFTLKADFGDAANFVKLNGMTSIQIDDISQLDGSNIRPGMFQIFFTLDDSKTKSEVLFSLFVVALPKFIIKIPDLPEPEKIEEQEQVKEGQLSYGQWIMDLLNKKMAFNQDLLKFSRLPPNPSISQITHTGNVTISFSSEIYVFPNITVYNNGTVYLSDLIPKRQFGSRRRQEAAEEPVPVMTVQVLPGVQSDVADLQYKWNVTQTNRTSINVMLYFDTPHRVSGNPIPDELKVTFYDTRLFLGFNGMLMEKNRQQLVHYLPPQLQREGIDLQVAQAIDAAGSLAKSAVVSNFVLNLILSASLSELLGMIQAQQIILLMSMFSLAIPTNVSIFIGYVQQITSFDIIDTSPYLNKMLNLNETEPYNSKFDQAGFGSLYFLNNMGSLILAFVFYLICLLLIRCINPLIKKSERLESFYDSLKKNLLYESIIATIVQSYMQISICCLIGFSIISFKTYGEGIQTVANFFFFGLLFLFPAIMMIVLCKGFNSENDWKPVKKSRFGAFFSEFNIEKGSIILLSPLWFMFRRLILAVIVVKCGDFLWLQIMIQSYSITASVIIIAHTDDCYLRKSRMKDALVDEVMTMFLMYNFICFTPFVPDYEIRYNLGYFCLIIWVGNFVYHLSFITHASFSDLILKGKIWWYRKAFIRERRILQQVRLILKPIYQQRWALKPQATHEVPDTEESSEEEQESVDEDELEEVKAAVKAVKKYIKKKNPKQVKMITHLKPINEEDEESSNEEDENSSSFQDSSVQQSVSDSQIEKMMDSNDVVDNDLWGFDCIEETKQEQADDSSSNSEVDDPKKRRENYLWRKQQKQLYNQMRSQFPQTNPMQIPNLIQQIIPVSAEPTFEIPQTFLQKNTGISSNLRKKSNQVQQEMIQEEEVKKLPRGRMQKKKDELLEDTLKYFEDKSYRHVRDPDTESLPTNQHSNRLVIFETSEQNLEEFLKLGKETPRSYQQRVNHVIELDQHVRTQMFLDNEELINFYSKNPKPVHEPREREKKY